MNVRRVLGFLVLWIIALFLFFVFAVTLASIEPEVDAATVSLPFANFGGYSTTRVLVNHTDAPVRINVGFGVQHAIAAHSVERNLAWPHDGGGSLSFDLPDGLDAYVEVRNPLGSLVRIPPLVTVADGDSAEFLDVVSVWVTRGSDYEGIYDPGYDSFVFLSAEGGASAVTVWGVDSAGGITGSHEILVPAGGVVIPQLEPNTVTARVTTGWRVGPYPHGDVQVGVWVSRRGYGEAFSVPGTVHHPAASAAIEPDRNTQFPPVDRLPQAPTCYADKTAAGCIASYCVTKWRVSRYDSLEAIKAKIASFYGHQGDWGWSMVIPSYESLTGADQFLLLYRQIEFTGACR